MCTVQSFDTCNLEFDERCHIRNLVHRCTAQVVYRNARMGGKSGKGNSEIAMGLRNVTLPHKTYRYWRYYV